MSQKQFLILIGTGIFCALLFAAPGLYRAFKESEADKVSQTANEPEIKKSPPRAGLDNSPEEAPSLEKYQELKLEQVRERVSSGDAVAQYELGRRYDVGEGVDEDDIEAMKWYLSSAKLGVPEAQLQVGAAYDLGWLKSKEGKQEALKWRQLAASQGLVEAQVRVAKQYLDGDGVPKDAKEAGKWFRKAAENGDADSAWKLAEILLEQLEADKSNKGVEEGLVWLRKAADLGNGEAQLAMGYMALAGQFQPHDLGAAASWWKKAAANGNTKAKNFISEDFHRSQQSGPYMSQELVMLYIKAAEQGDSQAEWEIGRAYLSGWGMLKENKTEAMRWLKMAADKGHTIAQSRLADAYLHGEAVEKNPSIAFQLYEKAANSGDVKAQVDVAVCFRDGVGCKASPTEALKWAAIASLGDQNRLTIESAMWLRSEFPKLKSQMTPDQINAAEALARDWHAAHAGKN